MNRLTTRTIATLALAGALAVGPAPEAAAHEVHYEPYSRYSGYAYDIRRPVPRWVRANRDFYRWYMRNQYRFAHRLRWHRLFELYRHDMRQHRYGRYRRSYVDRRGRRIYISY